jgi:hypothetical protein
MAWGGTWRKRYDGRKPEDIDAILRTHAGQRLSAVPRAFRGVTAAEYAEWERWSEKSKPMPAKWPTLDQIDARLEKTKNRKRI